MRITLFTVPGHGALGPTFVVREETISLGSRDGGRLTETLPGRSFAPLEGRPNATTSARQYLGVTNSGRGGDAFVTGGAGLLNQANAYFAQGEFTRKSIFKISVSREIAEQLAPGQEVQVELTSWDPETGTYETMNIHDPGDSQILPTEHESFRVQGTKEKGQCLVNPPRFTTDFNVQGKPVHLNVPSRPGFKNQGPKSIEDTWRDGWRRGEGVRERVDFNSVPGHESRAGKWA